MKKGLLYIHGKGGSSKEAEQMKPYCRGYTIYGIDLMESTPWGVERQIKVEAEKLLNEYDKVSVVANSIGAYYSMYALQGYSLEKAFFISPILDMEKLIVDMMLWSNVNEEDLREQGEIPTTFGETLSWEYLSFVRSHPIQWDVPTEILYAEHDNMTTRDTVDRFVANHHAGLTVMPGGEHWFHTPEQLKFLNSWLANVC